MNKRARASGLVYALGALCIGAIVVAFLVVGPPSQSASAKTRLLTVQQGVVQATVSGSGNLQAASQLNLGFSTAGVVRKIYVSQGQYVTSGQLLAELDPQSAEVTLEQTKATLQSAEAALAQEEESGGETAAAAGSGAGAKSTGAATAATASVHSAGGAARARPTALSAAAGTAGAPATGHTPASTAPAVTSSPPVSTTPPAASTTPAAVAPGAPTGRATTPEKKASTDANAGNAGEQSTKAKRATEGAASGSSTTGTSTTGTSTAKASAATREANLASARAAVRSDRLAVKGAEQSVANTRLYAPEDGTIVSLTGEVGESVSATGTSKGSTGASTAASASTATGAAGRGSTATSTSGASSSSGTGSSSTSSAFAVLSDLGSMQLVVPLSESEIGSVRVGQPATVTIEALEGRKLAAHVASVATLSTSNSGVVSYDVTFQLDQLTSGIKPGMSASAEVVVKQAEGVNVPTSAISGGSVTVVRGSKQVRQAVVTGLAGNSTTIVLSGLKAGEEIALPLASTTSSASSLTSRLAGRAGGGLGGGGFAGGGFGGLRGGG